MCLLHGVGSGCFLTEKVFSSILALSSALSFPLQLGYLCTLFSLYTAIPGSLALASLMTEGSYKASVLLVLAQFSADSVSVSQEGRFLSDFTYPN